MAYLMGCGHVANGKDANGKPICVICAGIHSGADIIVKKCEGSDGLEGRTAKCGYCKNTTNSNWELPFFEYCPNEKYDEYYCGCYGWD